MHYIDGTVLAIWNSGDKRQGFVPVFTKDTGLVGYPTFDNVGIAITVFYNPGVTFGGAVQIEMTNELSIRTKANIATTPTESGDTIMTSWWVNGISIYLESEKPNGAWFMDINGSAIEGAIRQ
jgi:hypothetical protein